MKFNKFKKIKLFSLLLGSTAIVAGTILPLTINSKINNITDENDDRNNSLKDDSLYNGAIIFNNKTYSSVDEATNDFISRNKIEQKRYIGDLESSYANRDLHTIDLSVGKLKEYDSKKIYKAYTDNQSSTGFTDSYEEALKGNIPIYQMIQRYDDYSGNDLMNLPSDYSIASQNLKNNLSFTHSLPYYKIKTNNNEYVSINPLNKKDIERLKSIAIDAVSSSNNMTNFKKETYYSFRDENIFRKKTNLQSDQNNNSLFNSKLNEILNNLLDKFSIQPSVKFRTKNDNGGGDHLFKNNYTLRVEGTNNKNNYSSDKIVGNKIKLFNDGVFDKNKFNKIDEFYLNFNDRGSFDNAFNVTGEYKRWVYSWLVWTEWTTGKKFESNNKIQGIMDDLFGKGSKITLSMNTDRRFYKEFKSGIDQDYEYYKILEKPANTTSNWWRIIGVDKDLRDTASRQVYFEYKNELFVDNKIINNSSDLYTWLRGYFGINDNNTISTNNSIYKEFEEYFINYILGFDQTNIQNGKNIYKLNTSFLRDYVKNNKLEEKAAIVYKNIFLKMLKTLTKDEENGLFNFDRLLSTYNSYNEVGNSKYSNELKYEDSDKHNLINTKLLNNDIKNLFKNDINDNPFFKGEHNINIELKEVITYNGMPLFMSDNESINTSNQEKIINVSNRIGIWNNYSDSLYIDLRKVKDNNNTWINKSKWEENFKKQLEHINKYNSQVSNKQLLSGIINSTPNKNEVIKQDNYFPGIFSALYYYDENLKFFDDPNNQKFSHLKDNVKNKIDENNPESFVTLYNKDITINNIYSNKFSNDIFLNRLEPMYYGEYFGRVIDFNDSFLDIKNFYDNFEDKQKVLNKMDSFIPSQITFYVDKKGDVISLDPIEDNVNISSTPTQSMYDPSDLVSKNAMNNFIVTHNTDFVYYKDDNNQKTLLKNNIEFLYSITIDKNKLIFDQYNYAYNYVKQYIILNGKKI